MSNKIFRISLLRYYTYSLLTKNANIKPLNRLCLCSNLINTWARPSFTIEFDRKNQQTHKFYYLSQLKSPAFRSYSMSSPSLDIDFEQLISLKDQKDVIVIDVREKDELKETGEIPGSFNIPLGEVAQALTHLNDDDFRKKYGFPKPGQENRLVFSCRSGKRSLIALSEALKAGYNQSLNFKGGWLSWEENTKK